MVELPLKDIPPPSIDAPTNMVLHALLAERTKADQDMALCLSDKTKDGSNLDPDRDIEDEYLRLDKAHNDANRTMYQVYSDSRYVIHDNNFLTYCKPHLHSLPATTAYELQTVRDQLQATESPPYRPIQAEALPEPTVPTSKTTLAQHAQRARRPSLRPRPQWMKDIPQFMNDDEADATYSATSSWMFGTNQPPPPVTANKPHTPTDAAKLHETLGITWHDPTDIRHPDNPYHGDGQKLRGRIGLVLKHRDYVKEFHRSDIPSPQRSPTTHQRMTAMVIERDRVEHDLYIPT
jgi:hypothetical protein